MSELTPQQQKRIEKLSELQDKGNLAILKYILDLEDKIDENLPEIKNVIERVKGDKGDPGRDGVDGAKGEKGDKGDRGEKGDKGIDGKNGKDGKNGRDGRDGIDGLDGKDGKDGAMGLVDVATIAYLETQMKDIKEQVKKELSEVKIKSGRGGGSTDKGIQYALMRSIQAVTPTGTINGSNTTFTVPSTIHAILSFELNSRVISLGEYTITGAKRQTIEFDTAPSASYSGKSFVITYI